MKALDTPVLLRMLRGDERAKALVRAFHGEELATTEWNLLELELALRSDPRPGRERRRAALDQLRRRLTVIPIDESVLRASRELRGEPRSPSEVIQFALMAAVKSRGGHDWVTSRAAAPARLRGDVRVEFVD